MKKVVVLGMGLCVALAFSSCKSSESAYKKAYEKAKQQELAEAAGILFAPERGEDTRRKIAEVLRKKGIRLNRAEMEDLVDQIAAEVKDAE